MKFAVITVLAWIVGILGADVSNSRYSNVSRELEVEGPEPRVFLTISSLASSGASGDNFEERRLELNWFGVPPGLNENLSSWVGLFSYDPRDNVSMPLVAVQPREYPDGYYRSSVQFPRHTFSSHNLTGACLGFWIAYVNEGNVLASSCFRAQPHWMHNLRSIIGNLSLLDLMLPGTHNAGSYAPYNPREDTVFYRYLITQEEDIWNQLVYGIRYLDLRVAYHKVAGSSERLWITHGMFRTDISVREVISQVKAFLNATNEIVIMDFHRFVNGFSGRKASRRHRQLITLLEEELGEHMIPSSLTSWANLNEFWSRNRTLYVGYAENSERKNSNVLFPAVRHLWGDVDTTDALFDYLNGTICVRRHRLASAMAELTAPVYSAIFDVRGGLRKMAQEVNRHVTRWFRDLWWHCANIISTDYFLGNNIIDVSIEVNKRKSCR